ncbi:hypothetical protein COY52_04035 [Candidatus Desantisbacteria bacterium CG_4_10_14_0_8_um_filter_48_22]|uniref:Uncharacterized protein n=1 Tax=Candidatus Desantisbacteria bacterium CG_4_10_14_0_8_um_filter_48_22 TaxID=1974543 RepID=A0A2M7SDI3_9BACT|nr:MAG: hypothetical protein AUJ67_10045 [Candidatus Desantisbacteria bacterium CG1_02_49_89]PIV54306.1 MAG: hypothetical protein COS16_11165 [Candidatus Desantisbacteria bacterium CG02_land_8_20_14_3_00_49_13]PIZ17549.1 MAG: hypothetical protein COY52_04035 [Candidatus Desantisbacteria bacterium CG_4_10_14_0_8_um_filter_48_22]PJB28914.1 MAG: hypothetical protein CO111_00325 [Candidatus Desantisbacteria bacterium CG_4_9_14_3_um_filter_50_7]
MEEKKEILGETYEPGKPTEPYNWRKKIKGRDEMLRYLAASERYWYSKEWFGSEKRKNPA